MLRSRLLLGLLAFGISFGVSWAADRNVNKALVSGLTTLPAAVIASVVVDSRYHRKAEVKIATLKRYIQTLKKRQAEIHQAASLELAAAREQLALNADPTSPIVKPLPLPPAPTRAAKQPISWDLSIPMRQEAVIEVMPHELPTELQGVPGVAVLSKQVHPSEAELSQVVAEATAAKRKIEANLKSLQTELTQLQTQVTNQRQTRDRLVQELADLKQQKQRVETESGALQRDVNDLKRRQKELSQHLTEAEARSKEIDRGTQPLQTAQKQLQTQVTALQEELRRLEIQIGDRRQQKNDLEQQLAALNAQHQALKDRPVYPASAPGEKNGGHSQPSLLINGSKSHEAKAPNSRPAATVNSSEQAIAQPISAEPSKPLKASDSTNEWDDFVGQLPEYELQVLRVIVEQNSPAAFIKKIAEDNLTMPEALIDSINERALETVGDIIIEPGNGSGAAAIAREHLRTVKKLVKAYGGSAD